MKVLNCYKIHKCLRFTNSKGVEVEFMDDVVDVALNGDELCRRMMRLFEKEIELVKDIPQLGIEELDDVYYEIKVNAMDKIPGKIYFRVEAVYEDTDLKEVK